MIYSLKVTLTPAEKAAQEKKEKEAADKKAQDEAQHQYWLEAQEAGKKQQADLEAHQKKHLIPPQPAHIEVNKSNAKAKELAYYQKNHLNYEVCKLFLLFSSRRFPSYISHLELGVERT
jgi:hypothetical protein